MYYFEGFDSTGPFSSNPYKPFTFPYTEWQRGFMDHFHMLIESKVFK